MMLYRNERCKNWDQNKRTSYVFYINFPLIYIMSSRVQGKFELQLMRGYEEQFRERLSKKVSLSYDCLPLNVDEYNLRVSQVLQEMKLINANEKDLSQHDEIILGRIEGQLGTTNFKQLIEQVVGEVSDQKIKLYLKQKSQQRTYGLNGKDKMSIVRQVKKLQSFKKYFNLQQINKKRKYNKLYSAALKNLAKYLDLYDKIDPVNVDTIKLAFQQYTNYTKEEKKFNNFVKQLETIDMNTVIEKPIIIEENIVQNEQQNAPKIEEQQKIDQQQINPQSIGKQSPTKNDKKPNEQKQNKTAKKSQKSKAKSQKKQQPIAQQPNPGEATQKEKIQQEQKQVKAQKQKALKKQKQEKQKTAKKVNINNRAITQFFSMKKKENPQQQTLLAFKSPFNEEIKKVPEGEQQQEPIVNEVKVQDIGVKNSVWQKFSLRGQKQQQQKQTEQSQLQQCTSLSQLRSQFRSFPMQSQQYNPVPYYTNIVMTLSILEYYDYFMQATPLEINFSKPFKKIQEVFYFEDQSQQFEGQSANEEEQQQQEIEEGSAMSENNTILSNDRLSNEEMSSFELYEVDLKVEYGKGSKWVFGQASRIQSQEQFNYVLNNFPVICLQDHMPLSLEEQEDNSDKIIITCEMWRDVYKMAHGYYGTKQSIVKEILTILPGVSKTWIDTMLKERSQKILNQRYIKKEFIEDIKQKVPDIQQILEYGLNERNQQLRKVKAQKNQQKDQKLQKDILECTGSRYIINLIKQLKQKGYKQLRRNILIEFINQRTGQQWDKIKVEINSMSRPIVEMLRVMNNGEDRIDEEVVVEDDEYNNGGKVQQNKNKKVEIKVETQNKTKKTMKQKQQKQKTKKRKQSNNQTLKSIYEKTKSISRARKTKNSLKTGIPSIDQIKKQKKQEDKNEQNAGQQQQNENNGEQAIEGEIDNQVNEDIQERIIDEQQNEGQNDEIGNEQISENEQIQDKALSNDLPFVESNIEVVQGVRNQKQQQVQTEEKEEIKLYSEFINPNKSIDKAAITDIKIDIHTHLEHQ